MAKLLTISSWVARGHVGNSATTFPLMRRGHEVVSLPTVVLAHHPGHAPNPTRTDVVSLLEMGSDVLLSPAPHPVDGILVGYVALAPQAVNIAGIVAQARAQKAGIPLVVDPIMGDEGELYVDPAVIGEIVTHMLPMADVIVPNLTELAALSDPESVSEAPEMGEAEALERARALGVPTVVVTSAPTRSRDRVANLLVTADGAWRIETPRLPCKVHGTGDLLAGIILSELASGRGVVDATAAAAAIVHDVLELTARVDGDEMTLVAAQDLLVAPKSAATVHPV